MSRSLNDIVFEAWTIAEDKGFHNGRTAGRDDTLLRLCLVHTEVSEASQVVKRHGVTPQSLPDIADELADVVIRVADLAGCLGIDLGKSVEAKLARNRERPHLYGTPQEGKS